MAGTAGFICDCPVLPLPRLVHEIVPVRVIVLAEQGGWNDGVLRIGSPDATIIANEPLIVAAEVDVIPRDGRAIPTDTIMDVMPIGAKREGALGAGASRIAQGVVLLLTGRDEAGEQIGEFGHSAGLLAEQVAVDAPGAPSRDDWIVRVAVTLRAGVGMERAGPWAAHHVADRVAEPLRRALLEAPDHAVTERRVHDGGRPGGLRIVLVKEVMGQGAMHDNLLLPREPGSVDGGRSIFDLGNMPVVLRPNEMRDGGLHSFCSVGPSTKETTLHYFRDPLLAALADDPQVDPVGVLVFGSPATEFDKRFVAERVGTAVHAMGADGAILATVGFGNNHIDFGFALKAIAAYGAPCVGATWAARQGRLVVGNDYMVALVEVNRSRDGRETRLLGENTAQPEDARRAVAMLKSVIGGLDVAPAPPTWDPAVVAENARLDACRVSGRRGRRRRDQEPTGAGGRFPPRAHARRRGPAHRRLRELPPLCRDFAESHRSRRNPHRPRRGITDDRRSTRRAPGRGARHADGGDDGRSRRPWTAIPDPSGEPPSRGDGGGARADRASR